MKKLSVISLFTVSLMVACAAPVKTSTQRNTKTYVFGTPEGFSVTSLSATSVAISFDYNGAVDGGYNVYYGDSTELKGVEGLIPSPIKTLANSITIGNVPEGVKTYFAVSALKADGTESDKTTIISIIPVALPGNQVQKTVHAQLEICVDQLDKIKFEGGKMILSDHADGSAFPGKADNCDIAGARLHTD